MKDFYKCMDRLGMRQPFEWPGTTKDAEIMTHPWYDWLINDYIPAQGRVDMDVFIMLGFDPVQYALWKNLRGGHIKKAAFAVELRRRFRDVHGVCDVLPGGRCTLRLSHPMPPPKPLDNDQGVC